MVFNRVSRVYFIIKHQNHPFLVSYYHLFVHMKLILNLPHHFKFHSIVFNHRFKYLSRILILVRLRYELIMGIISTDLYF